tara:strand:- start:1432 stop:2046 length:615 start_codon:yes stop_codon:yes gene_type:complete
MTLKLNGSSSGYVAIDAPAAAGSNTLVLPADNGSNGEYLQTNGSGTLDWAAVAGGDTNTPGFQVYKSGNCAVNHATHGEIVIDTELWDSASAYNTSTGRFTPQTAGTYFIYFECYPAMSSDQVNFIGQIRKNGSDAYNTGYALTQFVAKTGEAVPAHFCSGIFSLNGSSDYVSPWTYIWNYTSSSNNRNTQNNYFGGFRLGAAF